MIMVKVSGICNQGLFGSGGTKGRAIVNDVSGSIDGWAVDQRAFASRGGL